MVTPMTQDPPKVIYGPNGERAEWNGREYVVVPSASAQGGGYALQPMVTPAEQRAREEREYDRQRDIVRDERLDRTEERSVATAERQARTEERAVATAEQAARGGTPELRGRLALGLGPSVRAVDSMASQHQGVNPLNRDWGATLIDSVPDFGLLSAGARLAGGQDYQDYNQSLKTVESSLLPIFSGMAVTPTEAQRFMRANQPQLGDSPATIQRKTQNVQIILNEGAFLAGREIPYPAVGRYGEEGFRELIASGDAASVTAPLIGGAPAGSARPDLIAPDNDGDGLPQYPSIEAQTADIAGGFPGGDPTAGPPPSGPDKPGSSPENPIDMASLSPDALLKALSEGGFVRYPDGRVLQVDGATRGQAAEGSVMVAPGVMQEPERPGPMERTDPFSVGIRNVAAFGQAAAERVPFVDEAAAYAVGRMTGLGYDKAREVQNLTIAADRNERRVARNAGGVAGTAAALAIPATRLVGAGRPVLNAMAEGAIMGGIYGAAEGDGDLVQRGQNALVGAGVGTVAAPLAGWAAPRAVGIVQGANRVVGRNAGRAMTALNIPGGRALTEAATPNALNSGLDRWAERLRPGTDPMTERVTALAEDQIEGTFVDATDDAGRGVIRALATRQTPARQAAREFADNRAVGLQDRLSTQARRTISDDARSPLQMREEITAGRSARADQQFGSVRGEMVTPEPQVIEALRAPATRSAIEEAAVSAANRGDVETANMLRTLTDGALDDPNGVKLTVGMADRVSRALNGRAEAFQRSGNNDAAASYFSLAERLRGTARRQVPGYDEALTGFAADSRLAQATEIGEQFMSMEADEFASAVARLSPEEQQVARAAARRAVERQAGTQGAAPGVAQRLSGGREQGIRSMALLGDDAPRMQRAMGAERDLVMNARAVSPMQGSPTSANAQDALQAAGGAGGMARDVMTGNAPALITRVVRGWQSRGFNDREAEALVMAAIDPAKTREVIDYLAQRMSRRDARSSVRMVQRVASQGSGGSTPQLMQ